MSNTQINPRPSDVQSLIDAIHDNMSMSDGCHGHYRALAKLLALFIASEQVEHSIAGDLKRLSGECLSLINLIDSNASFYETTQNTGRAQQ
jgi:hypothetical protein